MVRIKSGFNSRIRLVYKFDKNEVVDIVYKGLQNDRENIVHFPEIADAYTGKTERNYAGQVTRLRLDWEFSTKELDWESIHSKEVARLTAANLIDDLEDLIENGDSQQYDDALLSALDGAKVRGKEPSLVKIASNMVVAEPKPRKESVEFTMYLLLYTEW